MTETTGYMQFSEIANRICLDHPMITMSSLMYLLPACFWIVAILTVIEAKKTPQNLKSILTNTARTALSLFTIAAPIILYISIHKPCQSSDYEFWTVLTCFLILIFSSIILYARVFKKSVLISTFTFLSNFLLIISLFALNLGFTGLLMSLFESAFDGLHKYTGAFFVYMTPYFLAVLYSKMRESYRNAISLKHVLISCLCAYILFFSSIIYNQLQEDKKYSGVVKAVIFND